jgi:hypothetical protein
MGRHGGDGWQITAVVTQAQGLVAAQAVCTMKDALSLLGARARTIDVSLETLAAEVVAGDTRFD